MYPDKQKHMDVDTIVSFVIQSWLVLEVGAISMSLHVNFSDHSEYRHLLKSQPLFRVT